MVTAIIIPAVWLLALLAAVAFQARGEASTGPGLRRAIVILAAFAISFALGWWVHPQPNWIAMTIALAAAWRLIESGRPGADAVLAGLCAGLAAALHVAGGLAPWMAVAAALGTLIAGSLLVQGRVARIRPVVLVIVALAAPVAGFAPDIIAGWRTGEALSQTARIVSPSGVVPVWVLVFAGLALLAGAIRGLWIRK